MPRDIEDAARDLYATAWDVFRRVTLPLLMPAVVAGATLAFVVSLDDFLITLMVAQAGATTLPVYLYSMLRVGVTPEANAAATILLLVSIAAVVLSYLLTSRRTAVAKPDFHEGKHEAIAYQSLRSGRCGRPGACGRPAPAPAPPATSSSTIGPTTPRPT